MLRSAGHDVVEMARAQDAPAWLRMNRANLAIIDLEDPTGGTGPQLVTRELRRPGPANTMPVLALVRARGEQRVRQIFEGERLANFLAVNEDDQVDPVELAVTVAKIVSGDIFGIERYLAPGARQTQMNITDSRQKADAVESVHTFAVESGCHARVAESVAMAADELVTNAIYNAPVDAQGKPRFTHLARTVPVILSAGEVVSLRMGHDGRKVAISVVDPFGSLSPTKVQDYLAKCFAKGEDQVDSKDGGAGLGLFQIFNMTQHFIINIAPHRMTEAIGLLDVTRSYKQFTSKARSFNVFVTQGG